MDLTMYRQAWNDLPYDDSFFEMMSVWKDIYSGSPPWKVVKRAGLQRGRSRNMSLMNTAKLLCDEFSHKIFTEQVEITTGNDLYDEWLKGFLDREGFWKNIPQFLSRAFAVGGGCIKEYIGEGRVKLNYINGDLFYPSQWDNRHITGGVFGTVTVRNKKYYTYLERHSSTDGTVTTERKLYRSDVEGSLGTEVSVAELYELDEAPVTDFPCFQYYKPDISNNLSDLPLGISCFANCTDTLRALDVAFDSFGREFILGRKRIIVPSSCIRTVVNPDTGAVEKYFDTDDEVYQAMQCDEDKDLHIQDNTVVLRVDEHVRAINTLLNILCMQTGLSAGTFSFDMQQGMKTATEVISQESKTAMTVKCHKNLLVETIEGMCRAAFALAQVTGELPAQDHDLAVGFKDSIIIDDDQLIRNNIDLVNAGLKSKVTAIMEIMRCDEETAQAELERVSGESVAPMPEI